MKAPTHDQIAQRAHELWQEFGHPKSRDEEIWLIAERQLTAARKTPEPELSGPAYAEQAANEKVDESHTPPTIESKAELQAEAQKQAARAPQIAHHTGPKTQPAPSGKPLWSKPHSS